VGFFPKHSVPGSAYLLARAEAEARLAEGAADEHAAEAHHKLADSYLGQLFGDEPPTLSPVRRTNARPENRQAMLAVFNHYAATLGRELAQSPDPRLTELLEQLDESVPVQPAQ
jgi:hypothetical protein